jgi:hypothetical protein
MEEAMRVNRRKMLAGALFGSLGLAHRQVFAFNGMATPKLKRINLVFHGLFTFVIKATGIQAITPPNDDHKFCYLGRSGYVSMGDQYWLEGAKVSTPTQPNPDTKTNAVMIAKDCGFTTDDVDLGQTRAFLISLPRLNSPKDMAPLRGIPIGSIYINGTYKPKDYKPGDPITYPMIQVISYDVDPASADKVILRSNSPSSFPSWQPYLGSGAEIENLHIFAEPGTPVSDCHAQTAFGSMAAMIHPKMGDLLIRRKVTASAPKPDQDTGIDGISPEEENTLQERNQILPVGAKPEGGIRVVNCMNLIVQ